MIFHKNFILSAHDVSNGGLLITLAEMAIGSNFGIKIQKPKKLTNLIKYFFGEDQARYVIEVDNKNFLEVKKILNKDNIYYETIGITQKEYFEIEGELKIRTKDLFKINNEWYNNF